jgi:MraZ protein
MFLGQHQLFFKDNRSCVIPEPFREFLADGVYITRGFENNLLLMSEQVFQEVYKRVTTLNIADPHARLLQRLILSNAARLDISASGELIIPDSLKSFAGMEKEIVLVGQGDYIELWSSVHWIEQSNTLLDIEANVQSFAQLDLVLN